MYQPRPTTRRAVLRRLSLCAASAAAMAGALAVHPAMAAAEAVDPAIVAAPTITLAPIGLPEKFEVVNVGSPLELTAMAGAVANHYIKGARASDFKTLLADNHFDPQRELADAVLAQLKEQGVTSRPGEGLVKFYPDDPQVIDYQHSPDAGDTLLVLHVDDLGLYSGRFTSKFSPRFNLSFDIVDRKTEKNRHSQSIYYGADARKDDGDEQITAAEKYKYGSYGEATEKLPELIEAYREGIAKMARLIALKTRQTLAGKP